MSEKQIAKNDPPSVLTAGLVRGRRSKEIEIYPKKAEEELARVKGCGDNPCCFRSLYFVPQTATNHLCGDCSSWSDTFSTVPFARHRAKFREFLFPRNRQYSLSAIIIIGN